MILAIVLNMDNEKPNEETPICGIDNIIRDATPEMMLRVRQAHEKSIQN